MSNMKTSAEEVKVEWKDTKEEEEEEDERKVREVEIKTKYV